MKRGPGIYHKAGAPEPQPRQRLYGVIRTVEERIQVMTTHPPTTLHVPLWTITDAAEMLGTSPQTIRRMIARGDLRAYRYGPRLIRIDPADVDAMRQPVTSLADLRGGDAQ